MYTNTCIYIHMYIYTGTTCTTYIYTYIHTYVYTYVVCGYICTYANLDIRVSIHTRRFTYKFSRLFAVVPPVVEARRASAAGCWDPGDIGKRLFYAGPPIDVEVSFHQKHLHKRNHAPSVFFFLLSLSLPIWMGMNMHSCMYINAAIPMCTYVCMYRTYVRTYVYIHRHTYTYMYVYTPISTYVYIYDLHTHTFIHAYITTQNDKVKLSLEATWLHAQPGLMRKLLTN